MVVSKTEVVQITRPQWKSFLGVGQRGDTIAKIGYKKSETLLICYSQNPGHHKINSQPQPQGKQIIHFFK